jgi:hypothetical protein
MLRKPIAECLYGWGQVVQLYDDHLDVSGKIYMLDEFVAIRPIYHHMLGIASVRLEIQFKQKKIVLPGIAAIGTAQKIVACLKESMWATGESTSQGYSRSTTTQTRVPGWRLLRRLQTARKLKQVQAQRAQHEHGFDVEQLARRLQGDSLPQIYVPTRLLEGECAHYCTDATLREEPLPGSMQPGYQVKDQGMLILTSRRLIYIGRRRQLVLGYNHLLHISQLQGAIAVLGETWSRREIFEMRLPLQCTMYPDAILFRFRQQSSILEQAGISAHSTDAHIPSQHVNRSDMQVSQQSQRE